MKREPFVRCPPKWAREFPTYDRFSREYTFTICVDDSAVQRELARIRVQLLTLHVTSRRGHWPLVETTPERTEWTIVVMTSVLTLSLWAVHLGHAWAVIWFLGVGIFALTIPPWGGDPKDLIDTERSVGYDDHTPVRKSRTGRTKG